MFKVEGLPEGWKVNTITVNAKENVSQCFNTVQATIHLKKIKPLSIVLDENILNNVCWVFIENYGNIMKEQYTNNLFNNIKPLLRIVISDYLEKLQLKENDLSLTNDEPKLSLTKKDMRELIEHIKLGGQLNHKVAEFIKDK